MQKKAKRGLHIKRKSPAKEGLALEVDLSLSTRAIFAFLASIVLLLGFFAIKDIMPLSVGKAYSILFQDQEFTEGAEIGLFAGTPEIILLKVDGVVKKAKFEFTGTGSQLTIGIGENILFSEDLTEHLVKGAVDAAAYINNFCSEYPCQVPIRFISETDSTINFVGIDIQVEELSEKIPPVEEFGHLEVGIEEDVWKVGTATKKLELSEDLITGSNRETLRNITTFIGSSELKALASGTASNGKGDAPFKQYFYLQGVGSGAASGYVVYTTDDEDVTADFLYFKSGHEIGRYVLEFTTALQSDVDDSDGKPSPTGLYLTDFEDVSIAMFGKPYTVVRARRTSSEGNTINLILMAEAVKDTLLEGNTKVYAINGKDYEVTLDFVSLTKAKFTVNGESTTKLKDGETYQLSDGIIILVSKILYQAYAGGVHSATFYLGRDKTELEDENIKDVDSTSKLKVNDKIIDDAYVILEGRDNDVTFKLDRIQINMTAGDDFYVPVNGRLSEIIQQEGGEPEVLFTNKWDIKYRGLKEEPIETIEIATSGIKRYVLKFKDGDGNEVSMPLAEAVGGSSLEFGEKDKALINVEKKTITKDDYLILTDSSKLRGERKTYVLQYKGADKITADSPKLKFKKLGSGETIEQIYSDGSLLAILKVGGTDGADFKVYNSSSIKSNDFSIMVDLDADGSLETSGEFIPITTWHGVEINITNGTDNRVDFTVKTPDDDKDENAKDIVETLQATDLTGYITASSGMVNLQRTGNLNFRTPSGQTNVAYAYTSYGTFVTHVAPAAAPSTLKIEYPKNQGEALVYYIIKEESAPKPTPIACKTSLDCPLYQKCENGACVGFCEETISEKSQVKEKSSNSGSSALVSKLNELGYNVVGQADIPDYNVQKASNKIIFSSGSETHIFDQQFDSFIISDKKGNKMTVQKQKDQPKKAAPSYIVEFKEKPLVAAKSEIENGFGVKPESKSTPKNIRDKVKASLDNYEQRLKEAKESAIKEMLEINPGIESKIVNSYKNTFNGISIDISEKEASEIKDLQSVKNIFRNEEVHAVLEESVNQISADEVWKVKDAQGNPITGKGVTIGIIDTGVDYTHADLGGCLGEKCKVTGGYDFVNNDNDPIDDQGHGTHVASTAAGNGILKGVAPDAKIVAYKVLDAGGSGSISDVIAGIERSIDPNQDGNFDDHLDIISLSLGGSGNPDDPASKAIDNAVDAGVIAVVAAGNSGPYPQTIGSPGTARNAITVGAVDKCDKIAAFSSRGPVSWEGGILLKPDVVAPGVAICAAEWDSWLLDRQCKDNNHIAISGTSMATPHVSGVAALLLQAHPDWTPEMAKSALMSTSFDLGLALTEQGNGRVDSFNALNAGISIYPQSLSFEFKAGESKHQENISIKNLLKGSIKVGIKITELEDESGKKYDFASLNATKLEIGGNSEGSFAFIADIPNDVGGNFKGKILISHDKNEYTIPFIFDRLSSLTLKATGPIKMHSSFIIHNEDLSFVKGASYGADFEGNNFTFKVPSGAYTAYAIGEFESDLNYILMGMVNVPASSEVELELKISDARPFTVKAESLQGVPLKLYQWTKGFNTYNDEKVISVDHSDPILGNQTIYISNKPGNKLDTDIVLYLQGVPAREEDING